MTARVDASGDTLARIRELEAELARRNSAVGGCDHSGVWCEFADFLWARAEKAEAELAVYHDAEPIWRARAEKAEARVAELEAILEQGVRHAIEEREEC